MIRRTRRWAWAALLVAFLLPLSALAQGKGEAIKVMDMAGTGNMLLRVAIAKGYCTKHGLTCERQILPSAPLGVQAVLSKSIDAAMSTTEVLALAVAKGVKIKAIGGTIVTHNAMIVMRNETAAGLPYPAAIKNLQGKKISVPVRNGSGEWTTNLVIAEAGLKPSDVTYVAMGSVPNSINALKSGQVDAAIHIEPIGAICVVEKWCRVIWRGSTDRIPAAAFNTNGASVVHVVRDDLLKEKPDMIAAFQNATKDAEAFIQDPAHFDEVVSISEQYFKMEGEQGHAITVEAIRATLSGYRAGIKRKAVKAAIDQLVMFGQLDKPIDPNLLIADGVSTIPGE